MIALSNGLSDRKLAIRELSALIARHNARQSDPTLCFENMLPEPTENLLDVIEQMRAQGYSIGDAVRFEPSSRPHHTEWHVPVANHDFQTLLAFHVPEDVC